MLYRLYLRHKSIKMTSKVLLSVLFLGLFIGFQSCKENLPNDLEKVNEQEKAYKANPTKETSAGYIAAVTLYNSLHPKTDITKAMLENAHSIALKENQTVVAAGINNELIKQFPKDPKTVDRLIDLANSMDKIGKKNASISLKYFLTKSFPQITAEKGIIIPDGLPENATLYLQQKAEKIFDNADVGGLNRNLSFDYVDACEAYVMVNPDDAEASRYLFNAAEISKTVGTFKKSLSLYDWVINNYPKSEQAPTAQFLKAFILEDNIKNIPAAKENYEKFIKNYPKHHFADDAQFSLDNLGKTNEEIQAELERLQKQNAGK